MSRERLSRIQVGRHASVRDAMRAIDDGGVEAALVVDGDRLVGVVTDGDVRRALLAGASLDDPVGPHATRGFVAVAPGTPRADVLDLMQARSVTQVPVVDDRGRLVGLHVLRELVGPAELPNVAVVMAGGRGRRLRPHTDDLPKPMLPVAGRPILERILLHLVGGGIREVFLAVHFKAEVIEAYFGDGARHGCRVRYLRDPAGTWLGSGGALASLPPAVRAGSDPLLVMNGDLLTRFDVAGLLAAHGASGAPLTVGIRPHRYQVPFGVCTTEGGRVVAFAEKPAMVWSVNAGVYVVDPALLDRVPAGRPFPITALVSGCVERGEPVHAHPIDGEWLDVGDPAQLHAARGWP